MTFLAPPFAGSPAPPTPPGPVAPAPGRPPRGRGRFLTGVALGAVVGAVVAGGIVAVAEHDTSTPSSSPAAAEAPVGGAPVTSTGPTNAINALVTKAEPSIVAIHDSMAQTDMFGRTAEGQAAGTGFVLAADGYIVTNNHVIDGATDITASFSDGTTADAEVVAADPSSDLAVLKVDRSDLTPLPTGDSGALQIGDPVVAIGNALDLSGAPTVTTGIVSAKGRSLTEPNGEHLVNLLQTDTAINPGNSGGPLLDMHGEVVGINTAIAGQAQNIGFAIAIDPAMSFIDQLRSGHVPEHALLGVSTRPASADDTTASGAAVVQVNPGSAADDAGLQAGDIITAVDGAAIASPDDLAGAVVTHQPGDKIKVTYERSGHEHTAAITLGARGATGS